MKNTKLALLGSLATLALVGAGCGSAPVAAPRQPEPQQQPQAQVQEKSSAEIIAQKNCDTEAGPGWAVSMDQKTFLDPVSGNAKPDFMNPSDPVTNPMFLCYRDGQQHRIIDSPPAGYAIGDASSASISAWGAFYSFMKFAPDGTISEISYRHFDPTTGQAKEFIHSILKVADVVGTVSYERDGDTLDINVLQRLNKSKEEWPVEFRSGDKIVGKGKVTDSSWMSQLLIEKTFSVPGEIWFSLEQPYSYNLKTHVLTKRTYKETMPK